MHDSLERGWCISCIGADPVLSNFTAAFSTYDLAEIVEIILGELKNYEIKERRSNERLP